MHTVMTSIVLVCALGATAAFSGVGAPRVPRRMRTTAMYDKGSGFNYDLPSYSGNYSRLTDQLSAAKAKQDTLE